jgi:EAL domain-containing protein (putative c-di-GMP-specific phosphodiesterase class I)
MKLLRAMKCTKIQGYLINRPRPAAEVPDMLKKLPLEARELATISRRYAA